jgi:hypothetical protein
MIPRLEIPSNRFLPEQLSRHCPDTGAARNATPNPLRSCPSMIEPATGVAAMLVLLTSLGNLDA